MCGELQPTGCRLDAAGMRQELAQMETTLEGEHLPQAVVTPTLLFLPSMYPKPNYPKTFLSPFLHLKTYTLFRAIAQPRRNWLPGLSYDEVWELAFVDLLQMFGCNWAPLLSLLFGTVHQAWDVLSHQPRFSSGLLP